jgi:hypothetical protein
VAETAATIDPRDTTAVATDGASVPRRPNIAAALNPVTVTRAATIEIFRFISRSEG